MNKFGNYIFMFLVFLLFFGQNIYSADSYRIPGLGGSAEINEHGTRKNVVNNCAPDIFVPTKTLTEWITNFIPNKPACVDIFCASGDALGLCSVCDGTGGSSMPADDSSCGTIDCDGKNYYYESGSDSSTGTNYCYHRNYVDLTSNRCASVGACDTANGAACTSYSNNLQATAGTCKYISSCSGGSSGTVSNYNSATTCSGVQDCDTNNYYYQSGTDSATGTNYCYYRDYADRNRYCNGAGSCNSLSCSSYSNNLQATAGACKYISSCSGGSSGTVSNYGSGTACSGTTDCDVNNYYGVTGTQGSTSTSYCKYYDYADVSNTCNGAGTCNAGSCSSPASSTQNTAGTCKYISSCSGGSSGTVSNYNSATTCSGVQDCDTNNYYYQSGSDSATGTNYCYYRDYADRARYCSGSGSCNSLSCSSYSNNLQATAGTCKYISSCSGGSSGSVSNYGAGTACSGSTDCDTNNYYYQSGSDSATSTNYCKYVDYSDVSNTCNGAGSCTAGSCSSSSTSTQATAGVCKYISSCSGGSAGSVSNYEYYTACSGGACDESGTCKAAINGVCGSTRNSCTVGVYNLNSNSATHYRWRCEGDYRGTDASCSLLIPLASCSAGNIGLGPCSDYISSGSHGVYRGGLYCSNSQLICEGGANCNDGTWETTGVFCEGACFMPEEKVLTVNGEVPIAELKVGDEVVSYDEILKIMTTSIIGDILVHDGVDSFMHNYNLYPLVNLTINFTGELINTQVTMNHPYHDPIKDEYKKLRDFDIGDAVFMDGGVGFIVNRVELINSSSSYDEKQTVVYNLHMKTGPSNYFVNGALVHNAPIKN